MLTSRHDIIYRFHCTILPRGLLFTLSPSLLHGHERSICSMDTAVTLQYSLSHGLQGAHLKSSQKRRRSSNHGIKVVSNRKGSIKDSFPVCVAQAPLPHSYCLTANTVACCIGL